MAVHFKLSVVLTHLSFARPPPPPTLLRHHSRKSRQRKKVFVETLKQEVAELTVYKLMVEEAGDMVSMHRAEDKVSPRGKGAGLKDWKRDCLTCSHT